MIDLANNWAATGQPNLDVDCALGLPLGGSPLVWSACPQIVEGMQEKSVRDRHDAGTTNFGYTFGAPAIGTAWRPPDW